MAHLLRPGAALGIVPVSIRPYFLMRGFEMSTPIVRKTIPPDKAFTERRGLKARPHRRFACAKLEGTYAITRGARMEAYKQEFIKFMVESDVLKVRQFTGSRAGASPRSL